MNHRWINRASLIKEIDDVKLPRSKKVLFRSGTVNSFTKGLAISLLSKIDFEGMMEAPRLRKRFQVTQGAYIPVKTSKRYITVRLRPRQMMRLDSKPFHGEHFPEFDFWDEKI